MLLGRTGIHRTNSLRAILSAASLRVVCATYTNLIPQHSLQRPACRISLQPYSPGPRTCCSVFAFDVCSLNGFCPSRYAASRNRPGCKKICCDASTSSAKEGAEDMDIHAAGLRRQLREKQRLIRTFDVGGTGVKTVSA